MSNFIIQNGELIGYTGSSTNVVIPNEVTVIGYSAFLGNKKIEKVTLPKGIESINARAFYQCPSLKTVVLTDASTLSFIGASAFANNPNLKLIDGYLPHNCQVVDGYLKNSPNAVFVDEFEVRDNVLIKYNGKNSDVVIPKDVTSIKESAFERNEHIYHVKMYDTIKKIGQMAFAFCKNLTSVLLSKSVTTIDNNTFAHCPNLNKINLNHVEHIAENAFIGCDNLILPPAPRPVFIIENGELVSYNGKNPNVVLPEGITSIRSGAFSFLSHIETIYLPDSITSLSTGTITNCSSLNKIILPPNTKISFERGSVVNCPSLTTIDRDSESSTPAQIVADEVKIISPSEENAPVQYQEAGQELEL